MQPPIPAAQDVSVMLDGRTEIMLAFVRLPLAAVGAVIMLVVGNSLARAFDVTVRWEEKKPG